MELEKLKKIIADVLSSVAEDNIDMDTSFVDDLGCDSLDLVQIVMGIEDEFDISIPDDATENIQTVGEAVEAIKTAMEE